MANVIFRGPTEKQARTVSLPVAGAYLPGVFVSSDGAALTVLTTAVGKEPLLLSNRDFYGQDVETAYAALDTGIAYHLEVGFQMQARLAAATYAVNDPLTIGASGYLTAATLGTVVVAFFAGVAGAKTAGQLDDVTIANSFVVPA